MALPLKLQHTFTPSEVYFLAENEEITVILRQSFDSIGLISTKTTKAKAMSRIRVPLWLALILKKQGRCNIIPPDWISQDNLLKMKDLEINDIYHFAPLPWHWLEIVHMLLEGAPDDLRSPTDVIRSLIKDIQEVRQTKVRSGIKEVNESHIRFDNLGLLEMNEMRPFVTQVMDELRKIDEAVDVPDDGNNPEDVYYAGNNSDEDIDDDGYTGSAKQSTLGDHNNDYVGRNVGNDDDSSDDSGME